MRYTVWALLIFGAGAVLGLVLVSANLTRLGWAASATMAASLAALPAALVADWWSHRPWRKPQKKGRKRSAAPARKRSQHRKRKAKG
jgi:hypothetical protein